MLSPMDAPRPPDDLVRDVPVWRVGPPHPTDGPPGAEPRHAVVRESLVELVLNGRTLVRAACLPDALDDFALGFLVTEGLIDAPAAVSHLAVAEDRSRVDVRADVDPDRLVLFRERVAVSSGCGGGMSAAAAALPTCTSAARFRPDDLLDRMRDLGGASTLFEATGGVHAAALTDGPTLLAVAEDIGRHTAVDKAVGRALSRGVRLPEAALLSTGRASADILAKAVRASLPVVVSRGAATSRAVELAHAAGVAVAGFARGRRMNVYTAPWRLGLAQGGPAP